MKTCLAACRQINDWESRMSDFQHDARTPLNAMMGFAQLMALSDLPAEMAEQAEAIVSSGLQMLTLIEGLQVAANHDQALSSATPSLAVSRGRG